ncbi:helix-turn-helix transcriptional regulator [Kitasatospora sp. NPDC052896]|uniref:helix-turn-helix transcriptional regulator n=1 Tax=Kitasatospora sp. NPDC052896 TaxID=3364061 RepID=UPI0037C648D7
MQKTSSRLLSLLSLLQTRRDWSGEDLAERLDISPRTVRRDIDRLRELGYPILTFKGPAGGYRLDAGTRMPPLLFDDGQAVALAVALQTAAGTAVAEDAARALATVRQVMPPHLRRRIDLLHITVVRPPQDLAPARVDGQVLVDLGRTIRACEELRFDYVSDPNTAVAQRRRVQPHHLAAWHDRWYLLAWDLDREDWRTFRADRIRPHTPTGPRFVARDIPGGNVSDFITSRFRGSHGTTAEWPCRGEVILHLPATDVAPFAHDGTVEHIGSDRCRLALGSWSWTALAAAIGRFDTDIEVIGPPELATAFADLATRYTHAAHTTRPDTGSTR